MPNKERMETETEDDGFVPPSGFLRCRRTGWIFSGRISTASSTSKIEDKALQVVLAFKCKLCSILTKNLLGVHRNLWLILGESYGNRQSLLPKMIEPTIEYQ
jgi:hypothetical protein